MDIVRTLATSVLFAIVLAQDNSTQRAGKAGHSVKLSCRLPVSKPPKVRWEDTVHSSSPQPVLIFDTQNNTNFIINSNHPNAENYKVDTSNFDLKISKLTFDDVGAYFCISENGPNIYRHNHSLKIYGSLECSGKTQLRDGETTTLRCEVPYSGEQPSLTWFRAEQLLKSTDRSGIMDRLTAAREAEVNGSHDLDGKTLQCQMQLADKKEECNLVMNVTYAVRDIGFKSGSKDTFQVGEEVTCIARGNPTPEVSLFPTSLPEKVADRKKPTIVIPNSWVGKEMNLECTAKNTYQGQERVERRSLSIRVVEKATMKPAGGTSGGGLASWKSFPLIMLPVTLMLPLVICC